MILGVGSDIIHIPRIAKAIENPRFVARVYTAGEIAYARGRGAGAAASFAARFAGKEAVMKAFGTGLVRLQRARRQCVSYAYGSRLVMKKNMRRHIVFWRDHYEYRICIGYADD